MLEFGNKIAAGGPVFMTVLFVIIVGILLLLGFAFLGKKDVKMMSVLIGHLSLFALIWGFFGSTLGLIEAFDAIEAIDKVSSPMVASGLKIALLSTLGGCFTFLIGRGAMFILALGLKTQKEITEA